MPYDIIQLDAQIREMFEKERLQSRELEERIHSIDTSIKNVNGNPRLTSILNNTKTELQDTFEKIRVDERYHLYILDTTDILRRYMEILNTPQQASFCGKKRKRNKEKDDLIDAFIKCVSHLITVSPSDTRPIKCSNCSNTKEFDIIDDTLYICPKCSARQIVVRYVSSYKDITRVNASGKYIYDRKTHFRECINQYQGKQNCVIPQSVYDKLITEFKKSSTVMRRRNDTKTRKVQTNHKETYPHVSERSKIT